MFLWVLSLDEDRYLCLFSQLPSPLTHRRYGMPKDDETHFEPASTSYGGYGMSGFPTHDLAFHVEFEFEPNVDVIVTLECIHTYFLCIITRCLFQDVL